MTLLIGHLLGDYVLQNDWLGMNKSKRSWICALHCAIYALSVGLVTWTLDWRLLVVAVQHFIFDRWRKVTQVLLSDHHFHWATERERMWLMFLYDNITHLATLWILYEVLA